MKNNQKPMKNQRKPLKTLENLKTKEKLRGNNTNARKSTNTVAKPMSMRKNDGEHPPTKKMPEKNATKKCKISSAYIFLYMNWI